MRSIRNVTVDYIKSFPSEKGPRTEKNGMIAYSYTLPTHNL